MNENEALNKIQKNALSDIDSQFYLGKYYSDVRYRDDEESFKWFKMAADRGHQTSQMYIGYSYEVGEGVKCNIKKALEYYKMAAMQHFLSGFFEYGQAKGKQNLEVDPKLYYDTVDSTVANTSYQAAMKYFKKRFFPSELPMFNVTDQYSEIKALFDDAINKC